MRRSRRDVGRPFRSRRRSEADFDLVDRAAAALRDAGDSGFMIDYGVNQMRAAISGSEQILGPLTKPTWFDRHVWRL
jgi:hypothetical protein